MSFTLIREERITQTGNGLQLEDDLYIKLDTAFDELVAELGRGGELPALIHIQLREAYAYSGTGNPATLKTIAHAAGDCSERQARRIVKSLLEKSLIAEAGLSPRTGEKFYRPLGYAWFGENRAQHARSKSAVTSMSPLDAPRGRHAAKCHPPDLVVVDDDIQSKADLNEQQQTSVTRKILQECGIFGKPLCKLSENVEPNTARAWQTWLETAPSYLRNPVGIVVSALLADADAQPPKPKAKPENKRRVPRITGKLATSTEHSDGGTE